MVYRLYNIANLTRERILQRRLRAPAACKDHIYSLAGMYMLVFTIQVTTLKGTKSQYSGQMSKIVKTVKTIDIQSVKQTEVCGKV